MAAVKREQLIGEPPRNVEPIRITARLAGGVVKRIPIALDSLLMKVHAWRANLVAPASPQHAVPIEIPVQRSECGTFHLCSFSLGEVDAHELRHKNRRPPIQEYLTLTPAVKRVDISVSVDKMYRVPFIVEHQADDELTWFALGDAEMLRPLLAEVHYLGKHTGWGLGRVQGWAVEPCDTWGDGFPVVRDGKPLRNLPHDWPGLDKPKLGIRCVAPPYWMRESEVLCAIPS